MRIGVVKQFGGEGYQPGVEQRFREAVELLEELGATVVEVACPHFDYALPAYYLILPSECSSATWPASTPCATACGSATTAPRSAEEVMALTRDAGFGAEVKRRIMLGTYALSSGYYDAYYGQAQKVRTLIARDFDAAFEQVDVLVSPTTPTTAFPIGERARRPDGDVPRRPVHDPVQPGRQRRRCRCRAGSRPRTGCRSACSSWPRRWPTTGSTGSAAPSRPRWPTAGDTCSSTRRRSWQP